MSYYASFANNWHCILIACEPGYSLPIQSMSETLQERATTFNSLQVELLARS